MISDYRPALYWDSAYAIALALIENHPNVDPEDIGLKELASLVVGLPRFVDDPDFVTDRILLDIMVVWYEELHSP
jgi:FeS assembly protein IscX